MPERHLTRLAGSGRNQHAVMRDFIDTPGGRAKNKRFAVATLEDHLFIQFAHANRLAFCAGKKDTIESTVRNCAAIQDCEALWAFSRRDEIVSAVPSDARTQFGNLIRGIAACKQIEHALKCAAAERGKRCGTPHDAEEVVRRNFCRSRRLAFLAW